MNFYHDFKKSISILSGITIKDVGVFYKFSKPGKGEIGHVQNIGNAKITFDSRNGGGDNGSDNFGGGSVFEVGKYIREKYDSLMFNIANHNVRLVVVDFTKLFLAVEIAITISTYKLLEILVKSFKIKNWIYDNYNMTKRNKTDD